MVTDEIIENSTFEWKYPVVNPLLLHDRVLFSGMDKESVVQAETGICLSNVWYHLTMLLL